MCYNNNVERQIKKREVIKMITKENAVQLVNEFETAKKEKTLKEANDFVERVVSPKIESIAKGGRRMVDISIAKGIDVSVVNKILTDNGFTLINKIEPRDITISW